MDTESWREPMPVGVPTGAGSAEAIVASLGVAVIATDLAGVVTSWNAAAAALYGWTAAEAVGRPITALVVGMGDQAEAAAIMASLISGRTWSGTFPVGRKDGRTVLFRSSSWPLRAADGTVVGMVGLSEPVPPEECGRSGPTGPDAPQPPATAVSDFDADAAAVEIVTRAFDPELRAAADLDPHGTVLPVDGVSFAELDELLASLVALAVHAVTVAADQSDSTWEQIVAAAALRLRNRY
jgi:PAS domain S-box-containing protein